MRLASKAETGRRSGRVPGSRQCGKRCHHASRMNRCRPHSWPGSRRLLGRRGGARAQTYPTRPVTVVVPFPAGGSTDWLSRLLGQKLEQRLKQPFVVENRAGGANVIAATAVAKSRARRPHAADDDLDHDGDQCQRVQEPALRSGEGFRAGRAGRRACRSSSWSMRRCRCNSVADLVQLAKAQAGRARLRLDRAGLCRQPLRGAAQERARRHRDDADPLQGQRARAAGRRRRPRLGDVLRPACARCR